MTLSGCSIFSRLVADQQFAGQGIVLLGIVADVAAAVTALAPVPVAGQVASAGEHGSLIGETVVTNEARNASVAAEVVVPTTGPPGVAPVSSSVGSSVPRDDDGDWELGVPLSRAELEELRQGVVSQDKPTKRRGEVVSKSLTAAAQRKKKR